MTEHTSRPALLERRFPGRRCPLSGKPLCSNLLICPVGADAHDRREMIDLLIFV